MDSSMNNFISDQLHVAQQSRREKLRVQHCSPSRSGPQVDGLEGIQIGFNRELVQVGDSMKINNANRLYDLPVGCSSEMPNLSGYQASGAVNSFDTVPSRVDGNSLKSRVDSDSMSCRVWKSVSANSSADNWNTDSIISRYSKNNNRDILTGVSPFEMKAKHQQSQSQYMDMSNIASQLHYQTALSDGVTTAVLGLQPNSNARGSTCMSWGSYSGDDEQVPNAPYGYQSDVAYQLSGSSWNTEMNLLQSRSSQMAVDSHSQGLSLSLCAYPAGSLITGNQYGNSQHCPQSIPLHNVPTVAFHDSKPYSPANFARTTNTVETVLTSLQESVGPLANHHRQAGPLGPFTGYATILKSSKFLRPAQQLLDEYCGAIGKFSSSNTAAASDIDFGESCDLATAVNSIVSDVVTAGEMMGAATEQVSDEISKGLTNSPIDTYRPDYLDKKAKLLYMLHEVSRRYKQYYQQMQMVVSAFESVAGLAGATPYITVALKAVSGNFNHLKNAISDQLRQIKTFLGEDFSLLHSGTRDKGDFNSKRSKYGDHSFSKHKSGGSNVGLLEPQQQIWRPQRGLPERAVSILRAWLFEHFLHPYPTDTDKHMLATQTGLTRSQVSNWFINARVRLWKPMVEEVHMLETKNAAETTRNPGKDEYVSTNGADVHLKTESSLNKLVGSSMAARVNLECPETGSLYEMDGDVCVAKQRDLEKHTQVDSHNDMANLNEGMFNSSRYYQPAHDISGIGSISLTLALRQSADQLYRFEGGQHQPYLQHQDRTRQHLGGHATHEHAG